MCGIAGFVSARFNKEHLIKMTNTVQHRGPDAEGHYYNADKRKLKKDHMYSPRASRAAVKPVAITGGRHEKK